MASTYVIHGNKHATPGKSLSKHRVKSKRSTVRGLLTVVDFVPSYTLLSPLGLSKVYWGEISNTCQRQQHDGLSNNFSASRCLEHGGQDETVGFGGMFFGIGISVGVCERMVEIRVILLMEETWLTTWDV